MGTFLVIGSIAVCLAQGQPAGAPPSAPAPPPPPAVDQALRARVTLFFRAMVDGKYRQAEQYVAADTQDTYYNMQKPTYLKFEIFKVSYSENFTRAHVVVHCQREVTNPAIGKVVMKVPQITDWKIENGVWFWYVDQNAAVRTPFGMMKPLHHTQRPDAPAAQEAKPVAPSVSDLAKLVSADKTEVRLDAKMMSDQVVVTNGMPGAVDLTLQVPPTPGLEVKLEPAQLVANQTGLVVFHYTPQPVAPKAVVVTVQVQPTGQTIPLRVFFEPPAQAKK